MSAGKKRPLRVLMLSQYPSSEREKALGGIMQATYQLIGGFVDLDSPDLELRVLSVNQDCRAPSTTTLGPIQCQFVPKSRSTVGIMLLDPLRIAWWTLKLCASFKPDIVHAQGNATFLFLSLFLGRRSVQTIHGVFRNEQKVMARGKLPRIERVRFFLRETFEGMYLRRTRFLIAITDQIASLVRQYDPHGRKVIHRINNSVDRAFFEDRVRLGSDGGEPGVTLLFVALITPRKGLHFLIEAFNRLAPRYPSAKLRIVGIWEDESYAREQQDAAGGLVGEGRVVFTGGVDSETLVREFYGADIFVLPSLGESAPMVISQSLCVGLPIVSTRVGGIPEMVDEGSTGLLVPPGDVDALRAALERLLHEPELRKAMAGAARQIGKDRYHPASNASATLAVYREVAAR